MKKFTNNFKEALDYIRDIDVDSNIWYEIRNNFYKWYIRPFTHDTLGIDMLIKYLENTKEFENAQKFLENIIDNVLFSNTSEEEQEQVRKIAKQTFLNEMLDFDKEYVLKIVDNNLLENLKTKNILVEEEGKLKFQNILIFIYLAATEIYKSDEIKFDNDLISSWLSNEYYDNEIIIYQIFSFINPKKFNEQFLKPNLNEFLSKIDSTSNLKTAQSIIKLCGITEYFNEYEFLRSTYIEDEFKFIQFLGFNLIDSIMNYDFDYYNDILKMKYLDENDGFEIDYTKEDKMFIKLLDEEGIIDDLVKIYRKLVKISIALENNPNKDYCDY